MRKQFIALAFAVITAAAAHGDNIVYSFENFEAGTPNYSFDGVGNETQLLDGGGPLISSDTAKIRLYRPPVIVAAPDNTTNHICLFDDITITGIPAPVVTPFVATITPAGDPNTGHDLQWPSRTGMIYSALASPDLAAPVDSWTVVQIGIAPFICVMQENPVF